MSRPSVKGTELQRHSSIAIPLTSHLLLAAANKKLVTVAPVPSLYLYMSLNTVALIVGSSYVPYAEPVKI